MALGFALLVEPPVEPKLPEVEPLELVVAPFVPSEFMGELLLLGWLLELLVWAIAMEPTSKAPQAAPIAICLIKWISP